MSGSGKGLIGLWLYKTGQDWTMREDFKPKPSSLVSQNSITSSTAPNAGYTKTAKRALSKSQSTKSQSSFGNDHSVIFSLKNKTNGLEKALKVFQEKNVNVVHIESRPSMRRDSEFEICVNVECDNAKMEALLNSLSADVACIDLDEYDGGSDLPPATPLTGGGSFDFEMPWFPRNMNDFDKCSNRVLMYGDKLDADHPGFKDAEYRKRRIYFAEQAMKYKQGDPIPYVNYTEEETKTWGAVFRKLTTLYPTHACREYLQNLQLLIKQCGYRENHLPQLEDVSNFLKRKTGFQIRPVAGYLSPRDFLSGLAFRLFHCTQYIRHSSDPFYTPEPDCCHELLGHVPMLADPCFAQFSQEIGLSSLGASDEDISKIATCYFFTVEFGLCKQQGELRVFGAGLLSSSAELQHALSDKAVILPFEPERTSQQECLITTFQDVYFYSPSFEDAKEQMRKFASTITRPFGVRYNPYTQSVEVLTSAQKIASLVSELKGDLCIVSNALKKIQEHDREDAPEN